MSLLTPERVPVKVYQWDDVGAPALDVTAGCVATIFKACLVTGYGTKEPAGWTMPFEDTTAGIKVLRPEIGPHTDFYLRLSADTGTQVSAQMYLNMTDVNNGDLKLECSSPYSYGKKNVTGKWVLIASTRGIWFFSEQRFDGDPDRTGTWFFAGDLARDNVGNRALYIQHTAGTDGSGDGSTIFGWYQTSALKTSNVFAYGKLLINDSVITTEIQSFADARTQVTIAGNVVPGFVLNSKVLRILPGLFIPLNGAAETNLTIRNIATSGGFQTSIVFGTSGRVSSNIYIATDTWSY